jgi:hypothetical protein
MPTINLRSAEFGDGRILRTNSEVRRTTAGQLSIVNEWLEQRLVTVSFKALSTAQKEAFEQLLTDNQGLELTFVDHESTSYTGLITTPVIEFAQEGDHCRWATSFELLVTA